MEATLENPSCDHGSSQSRTLQEENAIASAFGKPNIQQNEPIKSVNQSESIESDSPEKPEHGAYSEWRKSKATKKHEKTCLEPCCGNAAKISDVKICLRSKLLGLSSSESDSDEEYHEYFKSQLMSFDPEAFSEYPKFRAVHRKKKQARRDRYSQEEKTRRRSEKDKQMAERLALHKLMDSATEFDGPTLYMKSNFENVLPKLSLGLFLGREARIKSDSEKNTNTDNKDKSFGNRQLTDEVDVFEKNAW